MTCYEQTKLRKDWNPRDLDSLAVSDGWPRGQSTKLGHSRYQLYSQLRLTFAWSSDFIFSYFCLCKLVIRIPCCKGVNRVTNAGIGCLGTILMRTKQFPPLIDSAFQLCVQTTASCRASALASVTVVNLLCVIPSCDKHYLTDPGFRSYGSNPLRRVAGRVLSLSWRSLRKNL